MFSSFSSSKNKGETVFLTILARDKEHLLPRYLKCLENQDYNKKLITVYINTNNNIDNTEKILEQWIEKNKKIYQAIIYEKHEVENVLSSNPHQWSSDRLKLLGQIRNKSLEVAKESKCDYYFVVDCDNFIAPYTLTTLIEKDKPIIAPLLYDIPDENDYYVNYWCGVDEKGYFKEMPEQWLIFYQTRIGTFKVPLVHCTYLIKSEYLDQLTYVDDSSDWEFIIFSRSARANDIDQYVCNEKDFGVQFAFLNKQMSLEEEKRALKPFLALP